MLNNATLTGLRMMSAGLLCFLAYQYYQWPEGYWSVVTISAITQATMSATMVKAMLRLIGTCLGAATGFVFAYYIVNDAIWLSLVFCIFVTLTSYIALQTKPYNYASVVAGFTAVVILSSKILGDVQAVALYRTLEVMFGILVYTFVNLLVIRIMPNHPAIIDKQFIPNAIDVFKGVHFSKTTLMNALIISITTTLTFIAWIVWQYPYGFWTTITLIIIMEDTLSQTQAKSKLRLIGQTLAALGGMLIALYANGDILITGMALAAGFFISGAMIGGKNSISGVGNHAGSAIAIMLLVGLKDGTTEIVMARFFNVLAGILIANIVMWLITKWEQSKAP